MKIGIIGAGAVGAACTLATLARGFASEIMLVNRSRDRAKGMATGHGLWCAPVVRYQGQGW
jgi:L-lactate dehydrogenase